MKNLTNELNLYAKSWNGPGCPIGDAYPAFWKDSTYNFLSDIVDKIWNKISPEEHIDICMNIREQIRLKHD